MAAVNYLYRSKKDKAFLNLRLLFTYGNTNHVIGGKTKLEVSKLYWDKYHPQKNPKDIDIKNQQVKINMELNKIENHILKAFHNTAPETIDKEWLANQLDLYYNPPKTTKALPKELLKYFDTFLEYKKTEITDSTIKKYKVVRNLLGKYELTLPKQLLIIDVNEDFKRNFEEYCINNNYSVNTIAWAIRSIKTVCNHAKFNGLETDNQLGRMKPKSSKVEKIYLTTKELNSIEKLDDKKLNESLLNARDWLIISCYTGQRVSDFMRFTKDQIRIEKGKHLIEFTQKKTGKNMTIPLHPKVLKILEERDGEFPRPISSQKYNDYIKKVCKKAKIKQKVKGSKLEKVDVRAKFPYRKQVGEYEKWELVTSHIGRRSFANNFYGEIPTSFLIYVTGHKTEQMFLNYIGKSNKDIALELTKYF
ncbi:tyrosine-type recombinase/integrase [Aestuariivivens sediminicola]|uniref:tyrosine-type recombinase/integrase n=1 Tax=Aestuariivivens sediminicola TaxID=2913560 RepID=UPI001F5943BC|nr:phage integrase SAM-like domain-containing protein [Aestuariivivens sediminicola]